MAVSSSGGDEFNHALRCDDALDAAEVVAEFGVARDTDRFGLEGFLGAAEEFALAVVGEVDGVEFVVP